jgi:hypothetical protein
LGAGVGWGGRGGYVVLGCLYDLVGERKGE